MKSRIIGTAAVLAALSALAIWTGEKVVASIVAVAFLMIVLGAVMNLAAAKRSDAQIRVIESTFVDDRVTVEVKLENRSLIPVLKGRMMLRARNRNFDLESEEQLFFSIPARGETVLRYYIESEFCGEYSISVSDLKCFDIWGITGIRLSGNKEFSACMYPKWDYIRSASEAYKANYEKEIKFAGKKSPILSDVLQYRGYRKGDSLKNVNWKLSAKFRELIVREFDTPLDNQILVIPDIRDGNPGFRNMAYDVFFSICMTYVRSGIRFQLDLGRNGMFTPAEIAGMEDLFRATRELLGLDSGTESGTAYLTDSRNNLEKYARIVYVANCCDSNITARLDAMGNTEFVYVDSRHFRLGELKKGLKLLAL